MKPVEAHLVRETAPGGKYPLEDPTYLGRAPENNVVVAEDRGCSSKHAVIRMENGHWILQDLASRNGTWLNGQRIYDVQTLKDGDAVQVGSQTYRVRGIPSDLRCPRCKAEPPIGASYCPACGCALRKSEETAEIFPPPLEPTPLPPAPPPPTPTPEPGDLSDPLLPPTIQVPVKSRWGGCLGGILLVILLAAASFLGWQLFRKYRSWSLRHSSGVKAQIFS